LEIPIAFFEYDKPAAIFGAGVDGGLEEACLRGGRTARRRQGIADAIGNFRRFHLDITMKLLFEALLPKHRIRILREEAIHLRPCPKTPGKEQTGKYYRYQKKPSFEVLHRESTSSVACSGTKNQE